MDFLTIANALKFALPLVRVLIGRLTPGTTEHFLGGVLLQIFEQFVPQSGKVSFQAVAKPAIDLPDQGEWTEEGIARWAASHAEADEPDDAA